MGEQLTLTLNFQPDLPRRYRSLREAIAAGVHAQGLVHVAGQIDHSPSHLSEALAGGHGDRTRKLDVDDFERYMQQTGDLTPLQYLCAKFLPGPEAQTGATLARLQTLAQQMADAMAELNGGKVKVGRRRG